mmetsp:Transcript_12997/g.23116  ORF Transcript_12997/g.23116 Transcript_12997/m.23116 type:complete len:129 (-) Transcript_12997:469-855(-)
MRQISRESKNYKYVNKAKKRRNITSTLSQLNFNCNSRIVRVFEKNQTEYLTLEQNSIIFSTNNSFSNNPSYERLRSVKIFFSSFAGMAISSSRDCVIKGNSHFVRRSDAEFAALSKAEEKAGSIGWPA